MKKTIGGRFARFAILVALVGGASLPPHAGAATRTWTGANSGNWSDAGNWGGTAPVPGDDLVFPAGASNKTNTNDLLAGTSFNSIAVDDVGYTIGGNALTLAAPNALTIAPTANGTVTINTALTLSNAAATISHTGPTGFTQDVMLGGAITIGAGSATFSVTGNLSTMHVLGAIGESAPGTAIVKTGNSVLQLGAANTYSGTTTIDQGYVGVFDPLALGAGDNTAATGTVVNSGGTIYLGASVTVANERLVLNGAGQSGNGALQTSGGVTATWGGEVVLNSPFIAFNLLGNQLTLSGRVTGSGDLAFGRSTLVLTNPANDWAGSTTIGNPAGGSSVLRLGGSNVIPDASALNIVEGTLDANGQTETIGSLAGASGAQVLLGAGALTSGGNNASTTFGGVIDGTGAFDKVGTGTLTLTGVSATYTGTATVGGGTLALPTGSGLPTAIVRPAGGTLAADATVGMIDTMAAGGGTIAPGINAPGRIVAGQVTILQGNTLAVQLNGTTAATQYDQIASAGAVTLGGTLAVTIGYSPAVGDAFRIVDNNSSGPVLGTFAGLPEGATMNVSGVTLRISYAAGDGNDVVLTVLSLPSGPPSITTTSPLPGGTVGAPYSTTIAATGGTLPYTWAVTSGTLPANLSLNPSSGAITGTPTAAGTANFTVTVTDNAMQTDSRAFALTIAAAPAPTITTTSPLAGGMVGVAYSTTLAATGGTPPYSWAVTAGSLPAGLSLNPSTGAITGTPTVAGSANFTVTVTDSAMQSDSRAFALAIAAAPVAAQPIPALDPWTLAALSLVVAWLGMRRRR